MTSDGECEACGSDMFLKAYMGKDEKADFALVCPNCDQIENKDAPVDRDDAVDYGD